MKKNRKRKKRERSWMKMIGYSKRKNLTSMTLWMESVKIFIDHVSNLT